MFKLGLRGLALLFIFFSAHFDQSYFFMLKPHRQAFTLRIHEYRGGKTEDFLLKDM